MLCRILVPTVLLVTGADLSPVPAAPARPNVLFIVVDDLRPVLGCYGDRVVKTPNIDRLAESGMVFERAYCQLPSCCPSRTSVLTGLRVETTGVTANSSPHFRQRLPDHVTLPQFFKQHGYFCKELGKVFHRRDPQSWSEPKWIPQCEYAYPIYTSAEAIARQRRTRVTKKPSDWWGTQRWIKVNSWEAADVADEVLFDGQLATQAVAELDRNQDRPFFLAVGFFRPHLPFIAPQRYFDLYPEDSLRLPERQSRPEAPPECAVHRSPELRTYVDISRIEDLSRQQQERLLRAYYAAVSYVDAQIGRVLDELNRLHLRERTIVVLWSDHGYHLGDRGLWGKATNFEESVRSTLIVSAPGIPAGRTKGLAELVDLYPSLCELCDLSQPQRLEGTSFVPLMRSPDRAWKSAAFSQASPRKAEGFSMRTDRYRYTEWHRDGGIVATELYDHEVDPDEMRNIAAAADPDLLDRLRTQLRAGWKAASSGHRVSTHP